jgi:hypothetical protein
MAFSGVNTPGTIVPSLGKVRYTYTPAPSGECWQDRCDIRTLVVQPPVQTGKISRRELIRRSRKLPAEVMMKDEAA